LRFAPIRDPNVAPALAIDGAKGLPAIEAFIMARLFMFQQVYLHKATRAAEWMIRTALARVVTLVASGQAVASVPAAISAAARAEPIDLGQYLELDDATLAVAMHAWESSSDRPLADLCRRVRARSLFKTLELFGDQATEPGRTAAFEIAKDVARRAGFDPEHYVGLDVAADVPLGGEEEPIMVVYAKGPARPLHEASFLLGRLSGQVVSRVRLIFVPELRSEITHALGH
jgi:HD superfamily phosphohydrolase